MLVTNLELELLTLGIITGIHSKETFYRGCQDNPQVQQNKSDNQRKQHKNCLVNVSMLLQFFFKVGFEVLDLTGIWSLYFMVRSFQVSQIVPQYSLNFS